MFILRKGYSSAVRLIVVLQTDRRSLAPEKEKHLAGKNSFGASYKAIYYQQEEYIIIF